MFIPLNEEELRIIHKEHNYAIWILKRLVFCSWFFVFYWWVGSWGFALFSWLLMFAVFYTKESSPAVSLKIIQFHLAQHFLAQQKGGQVLCLKEGGVMKEKYILSETVEVKISQFSKWAHYWEIIIKNPKIQCNFSLRLRDILDKISYQYIQHKDLEPSPKSKFIGDDLFDKKIIIYSKNFQRDRIKNDIEQIGHEKIIHFLENTMAEFDTFLSSIKLGGKRVSGESVNVSFKPGLVIWKKVKIYSDKIGLKRHHFRIKANGIKISDKLVPVYQKRFQSFQKQMEKEIQTLTSNHLFNNLF